MKKIHKQLGEKIKEIRKQKGISQEELSFLAGLDRSYMGGIERGERNPSLANIVKIAETLEISLQDLFNFEKVSCP